MTITPGGHVVGGDDLSIAHLKAQLDELAEWRDGRRERQPTFDERRHIEALKQLEEVILGLGWTPPAQS